MEFIKKLEVWFVVGSQHLYGAEALQQVKKNAEQITSYLNQQNPFIQIKLKAVATTPDEILSVCQEANNTDQCAGLIAWMHTFSPSKMWIAYKFTLPVSINSCNTDYFTAFNFKINICQGIFHSVFLTIIEIFNL